MKVFLIRGVISVMIFSPFSVLMSLYSKEKPSYLDECFQSLKDQTLQPSEIIIVFDGPVGGALTSIVDKWSEELNIKKIVIDKNVGLGLALNEGMKSCSNEYIARMDTDDICYPQRFERQMSFLLSNPHIELLGCNVIEFDEVNNERVKSLPEENDEIKKYSELKNPFNHMSVIFKKSRVMSVGGYNHHLYMEDYNLWLRMLASNVKTHNLNEILLKVRVGSSMLKRRRGLQYIKSEFQLYRLKNQLKTIGWIKNFIFFAIRLSMRIIPIRVLSVIYSIERKSN